ncbi:hypothetical protein [Paenibacillus dendritiformis]|uniref:hypothetical protein n=1 Tax=Paenibacillus dendritiformis TaxID=130049 RepID=UPI001F54CD67|nr:hypothetical protein [Paenibacillus dendritiformis]
MALMFAFLLGIALLFAAGADGLLHWLRTGDPLRMLVVGLAGGGAAGMIKLLRYVRGIYHLKLGPHIIFAPRIFRWKETRAVPW